MYSTLIRKTEIQTVLEDIIISAMIILKTSLVRHEISTIVTI